MVRQPDHDDFDRILAAHSLALALNPTLDADEIAHRLITLAAGERPPLAHALGRLVIRSLDSPSPIVARATTALRHALEITTERAHSGVTSSGRVRDDGLPLGPAA